MANEEVRGFNIELGLDHAGVDKGLKDLQRQMKLTNSEFDKNLSAFQRGEESMERYEATVEGLNKKMNVQQNIVEESRRKIGALDTAYHRQRQALDKAGRTVDETRKKYDQLQNSQSASEEELKSVEKELKQAETDYGKLSKAVDKTARELDKSEVSLNNAEKKLNGMRQSLSRTEEKMEQFRLEQAKNEDSLVKFGRGLQDSADDLRDYGESLDKVANIALGVSAGITAIGAFAGLSAVEMGKSSVRMQNSLGLTEDAALDLVETSKRIYEDGFGDSLESVDNAVFQVKQNIRDLNDEDLEDITQKAIILSETFDADVNEVTRAANNLMEGFGIESTEAFDLMAYGAQNGLNFSNELFDNLSEYSTLFGHMGYDADEYFQLLQNGLDAGAYNLDYINDVMKEFQIRIKDSSDATSDAFAGLSEETQEVWRSFIDGEGTVKDVMEAVTGELSTMEDQTKANEIGVQLFGTKFEDLEADAVYALGNVDGELKNVDGTASQMAENLEESVPQRALGLWREAKDILLPLGEVLLDVAEDALPAFESAVETATDKIAGMEEDTLKTIGAIGGIVAVGYPVIKVFGGLAKGAAPVIGVLGKMAEKFGETKVAGGKAVGKIGAFASMLPIAGTAASALTNPVGLAIGAVAALGGGFVIAYNNVEWFKDGVDMTLETLKLFSESAMELTGINWLIDQFSALDDEMAIAKETAGVVYESVASNIEGFIGERIVEPFEEFRAIHREAGETVDVFQGDVSEATQLMLEDYVALSEGARLTLDELYYGQEEVTTAQVEDLQEKYRLMNEEAQMKLQERRENELTELEYLYEETEGLNDTERERALEKLNAHYNTEEDSLNSKNQRIQEIIEFAMENEGGLTEQHYELIERLQNDHNTATVETLSQGEVEQQAILERMKTNQLATSEETVEKLIEDAKKAKNTSISEAEEKRDKIVEKAIRQRDETGNISEEEAQKIIDEAEREYRESVKKAEGRYDDVLSIASDQASEHGIIVDEETGEILTKWDIFKNNWSTVLDKIKEMGIRKFAETGEGIAEGFLAPINWMIRQFNKIPKALGSDFKIGEIEANFTGGSGSRNGNSYGYRPIASYENGTDNHAGGMAIVNDGDGPELIQSPDGSWGMAEGKNALVDMDPGAKVIPAAETRQMMSGIKPLVDGAGGILDTLGEGANWVKDKVSDIWSYVNDPGALVESALNKIGFASSFTGINNAIFSGMVDKMSSLMTDRVKSLFEASTRPVAGILDPNQISFDYGHTAKYTAETGRYWHSGVDFPFVYQPVRTPIGGTVTHQPFDDDGYGRWLTVMNGDTKVLFAHLDAYRAMNGASVKPGDVIGKSGNTGFSTGPHTHVEYHENGQVKNPRPWLQSAFRGSFADGGIIDQHGFYEGAEGNLAEMVIPLTKPNRAMELMQQAMAIMGGHRSNSNNASNTRGNRNGEIISALLDATMEQNEILRKLLNKETSFEMDGRKFARLISRDVNKEIQYLNRRQERFDPAKAQKALNRYKDDRTIFT